MVFNAASHICHAPKLEHFADYDVSTTVKEMNKKLCLFESVSEDFSDKWNFQCHNSNIALVCMGNNAIGHELRVSKNVFNLQSFNSSLSPVNFRSTF